MDTGGPGGERIGAEAHAAAEEGVRGGRARDRGPHAYSRAGRRRTRCRPGLALVDCGEYSFDFLGIHVRIRVQARDEEMCRRLVGDARRAAEESGCDKAGLLSFAERFLEEHGGCRFTSDGLDYVIETGDGAVRVELSLSGLLASTLKGRLDAELERRCRRG